MTVTRLLSLLLCLCCAFAPALRHGPYEPAYDADAMYVEIDLDASSPVLMVGASYYLEDRLIGGGAVVNAKNGLPLDDSSPLRFAYARCDFTDCDPDGRSFAIALTAVGPDGQEHEAGRYDCTYRAGEVHRLVLSGSDSRYTLAPVSSGEEQEARP